MAAIWGPLPGEAQTLTAEGLFVTNSEPIWVAFSEDLHLFAGLSGTEDFFELWEAKQFSVVSSSNNKDIRDSFQRTDFKLMRSAAFSNKTLRDTLTERSSGNENGTGHSDLLAPTGTDQLKYASTHQENHAEHRVFGETAPRSRSTGSNRGRAQVRTVSAHSHGTRATDFSGRSSEDVKITVKAFLAEKGVQANSKAWHHTMQSEHVQRMAIACVLGKTYLKVSEQDGLSRSSSLAMDCSPAHEFLAFFSQDLHLFVRLACTEVFFELWKEKQFSVVSPSPLTTKTSDILPRTQTSKSCDQRIDWSLSHRNL